MIGRFDSGYSPQTSLLEIGTTMPVNVRKTAKIGGTSLTLNDLRELVKACESMPGTATVRASTTSGSYGQSDFYTVTVTE